MWRSVVLYVVTSVSAKPDVTLLLMTFHRCEARGSYFFRSAGAWLAGYTVAVVIIVATEGMSSLNYHNCFKWTSRSKTFV